MGASAFQRARRLAAAAQGQPAGAFAKLNYDAALKVAGVSAPAIAETVERRAGHEALLQRLNTAKEGADLATLPTIGKGAGKAIVENRPEGGYKTLKAAMEANERVTQRPYTVVWEVVMAHFAEVE